MVVGYFGVIRPQQRWWQGYFLHDDFDAAARGYLADLEGKPQVTEVIGAVPPVIEAGAGRPPIEGFVAVLGSALCRAANDPKTHFVDFGIMSYAFALITGLRYFELISKLEETGGETTSIADYPNVRNAEQAREVLNNHPLVQQYKQELAAEAMADLRARMHTTPGHA